MGKGSVRRPPQIPPEEEARRWAEVFGEPAPDPHPELDAWEKVKRSY